MMWKIRNSMRTAALWSVFAVAAGISPAFAQDTGARPGEGREPSQSRTRRIEGTWFTQVSIRDCQTGAELRTFPALNTFAEGGTLSDTTTGFGQAQRSPGLGFWEKTGRDSFRAVSVAFIFNPAGVWTGTQRLTHTLRIGPDQLTFNTSNRIVDLNGVPLVSGCASAVARRLE
jgi:hypothetical protein